jgi:adenosylmethionine-8-amino-7-oxononanoate aminotransferase
MKTEPRADYSMTAGEVLPVAVRAEGCWIEDSEGRRYLDACGGAMVMLLGHNHPALIEAMAAQSRELSFIYRFSFRNEPMLELAERIADVAPGELEWCFFNSSGSEANESAMHLSVLYWELLGKPGKTEFLSRATSYHGSTLGALSLSGSRWRAPFEPLLHKYAAVPNSTTAEEGAAELEAAIMSRGADHIAAFMIEPVTGSSGAAVDLPDGYLAAVREVCDRYEVLLIADEIVSGFGRTGEWFAVQHHGATPDVISFGKAIGGGVLPLSGMIASRQIREVVGTSPTGFSYGHTFSGYPLGCAVGCAVLDVIEQEGLIEEARRKGARLRTGLEEIAGRHPSVSALRGRGMLQGIELQDPATGDRFDASRKISYKLSGLARDRDLMIYSCPTPVLNRMMDAVLLAPPLIITDAELDIVLERLDDAFGAFERAL